MDNTCTQLTPTRKLKEQDKEKLGVKQTLSLSSSVTNVRGFIVTGINDVHPLSLCISRRQWSSDQYCLFLRDLHGEKLQTMADLVFPDK